jgi:OOP family OmpA-OmpF porin
MQKKILTASLSLIAGVLLASNAAAADKSIYVGGLLGWGDVHQAGFSNLPSNTYNDTGFAGRVFAGYKFNQYVAIESGFTKFSNMNASGSGYDSDDNFDTVNGTIKSYAIDLVAKGILPLQYNFDIFGTFGIAYINQYANINVTSATANGPAFFSGDENQNEIAPTFGLGAEYNFNQNISAQIAWSHIQAVNNDDNSFGNTDLIGLGLTYNFS